MILGIDIDTTKLTLCGYDGTHLRFGTARLRQEGRKQGSWYDAVQAVPGALVLGFGDIADGKIIDWPREAYIERGWGANRNADYQLGAILGATVIALPRIVPGIHVDVMTTHEWKRAVTAAVGVKTKQGKPGNANAAKELANSACRIILMEAGEPHERVNALTSDQLDAFGVAWTAHGR